MEAISSTIDVGSDFVEPTQDSPPEDESCSELAEIQICAVNCFSAYSIHPSIPTDIRIYDYSDPTESCSTPGLEVIRDPAMDRRSAKLTVIVH